MQGTPEDIKSRCKRAFRDVDADGSGIISRDVLISLMCELGMSEKSVERLLTCEGCGAFGDAFAYDPFIDFILGDMSVEMCMQFAETLKEGEMAENLQGQIKAQTIFDLNQPGSSATYLCLVNLSPATGIQNCYDILQIVSLGHKQFKVVGALAHELDRLEVDGENSYWYHSSGVMHLYNKSVPDRKILHPDGSIANPNAFDRYVPVSLVQLTKIGPHPMFITAQGISNAFTDMAGGLMTAVKSGSIRLLRGRYIEEQWAAGKPLARLQDLPKHALFEPVEAAGCWAVYGPAFFLVLSYAWISAAHPDPEMYHLERLARIISEYRAALPAWVAYFKTHGCIDLEVSATPADIALFWDFCSLPQRWQGEERTPQEELQFKEGLQQVDVMYGHERTTVLRCKCLPAEIKRRYDDRGWPLFEMCVTDAKPSAALKVFAFDSEFDPKTQKAGMEIFLDSLRRDNPPRTPEQFEQELELRRERAAKNGEVIFTNGKDCDFLCQKYGRVFYDLCQSDGLSVKECDWSASQLQDFCELLPMFDNLKHLVLDHVNCEANGAWNGYGALAKSLSVSLSIVNLGLLGCGIDHDGAVNLVPALCQMHSLKQIRVSVNPLGDKGAIAILGAMPSSIEMFGAISVGAGDEFFSFLASSLPCLSRLRQVNLTANRQGSVGIRALANCLAGSALQVALVPSMFVIDEADLKILRVAWRAAGKSEVCLIAQR